MRARDLPRWLDSGSDVPAALRDTLRDASELEPSQLQLERLLSDAAKGATAAGVLRSVRLWAALSALSLLGLAAAVELPSAPQSATTFDALTPEVLLLLEARRALPAAPARAERLLREHRRTFAHGDFVEEREELQVETLWRSGDRAQARANFAEFARSYPGSPYLHRLEGVLLER